MTKKDLKNFHKLQIDLKSVENEIAKIDAQIKRATAVYGITTRGGKNKDGSEMIIELIKLKKDYQIRGGKIIAKQKEIERGLDMLSDPVERAVLRYRYIDNMEWSDVQIMIGYERSQTYRIHDNAINNLKKINMG